MKTIAKHRKVGREKKIPKIRFGSFAEDWTEKNYGDVFEFKNTNSFSRDALNYENGAVKNIHYGDIHTKFQTNFDITCEDVPFINQAIDITKIKDENYCKEGDLVIADASEDYTDVGKTIELRNLDNQKLVAGLHTYIARPKNGVFALGFPGYLLQSWTIRLQIMMLAQGTKVHGISSRHLVEVLFKFPTLPEQQKIAYFLTAVDKKIQQLTRKKELLEQYKKGVMQKLFSQELRFKDKNGNDYPDWEEKMLGGFCEVNPKNDELPDSFVYIDLESVVDGQLIRENIIEQVDAPSRAQRLLKCDDILYQTVRPYQRNNLFFDKTGVYVASTGYAQMRAEESSMFLFQLLHTEKFVNNVLERCTGTSYPAIKSSDLSKIKISVPCVEEQQKIANYLSAIDTKIETVNNQIIQTQTFKKGLLQQMFV